MKFTHPYSIGLHDSDAAGVVFLASLIRICHQAYEAMMESVGFGIGQVIQERKFGLPIAHVEGDFKRVMRVGNKVEIRLRVTEIKHSSYRVEYEVLLKNQVAATAATVHVCVDPENYQARELPTELRKKLQEFVGP
jgi:1,4-dihydroxy-2-naphthoyl-CoA hydrolase